MRRGCLVALLAAGCGDDVHDGPPPEAFCAVPAVTSGELEPFDEVGFVAHAGGSPSGLLQEEPYSNTREAFDVSWANGYRAFEFDLMLLADGVVVAVHDHHEEESGFPGRDFLEMTSAELEGARWNGKYELVWGTDLIDLMVEHPDMWLILDTKVEYHYEIVATMIGLAPDDSVRDRLVPHLANQDEVDQLADLYPLPERLLAHYKWVGDDATSIARMVRNGLDDIMMSADTRWSEETQQAMEERGYHVWVHTPHAADEIEAFRARGVGVYTDGYITCGR